PRCGQESVPRARNAPGSEERERDDCGHVGAPGQRGGDSSAGRFRRATGVVTCPGSTAMKLHILGSGTPVADAHRHGSSYVVNLGDQYLMFDSGPATTNKLVRAGIRPTWVDYLIFTHHHFDHNVDYPCFLLTRWD